MSAAHSYTQPAPVRRRQPAFHAVAATATGARFSLRPLGAGDREALRTLFARLSPESRRRRFLTPKLELSDRELTYLTDVDHVSHEALAAVDRKDGSIVGVARYATWPQRAGVADFAIEVADDFQRQGIGLILTEALIRRARENGIEILTATTLWDNRPARALARRVGFRGRSSAGNEIELELRLSDPRPARAGERSSTAHVIQTG